MRSTPPLAGGTQGPDALRPLLATVLDALHKGAAHRGGPLPAGGPEAVTAQLHHTVGELLPTHGTGPEEALRTLVTALTEGAADPADPLCAAHLHCPPLAVATAADLAASALNPSMDSWDQAPAASALETLVTTLLAHEVYGPGSRPPAADVSGSRPAAADVSGLRATDADVSGPRPTAADASRSRPAAAEASRSRPTAADVSGPRLTHADASRSRPTHADASGSRPPAADASGPRPTAADAPRPRPTAPHAPTTPTPDALVTTGGTEANQLAVLLARETAEATAPGEPVHLLVGANAHHSLARAAWLLGLPEPVTVPAPAGTLDPAALDEALTALPGPKLVAATAGTTDAGLIDPLPEIADICERHGARLHIDAAYGAGALFSPREAPKLHGLARAHTVALDLHKLGWQPVAAGILAVRDTAETRALGHQADYLNADDDTEAGLPDLLGRSLRTTRRPDILKTAVTFKALGRTGLAALVDDVTALAHHLAQLIDAHPHFELYDTPTLTTVLFRPTGATDETIATIRRTLLTEGRAVLGRARMDGKLHLKATLLNPHATPEDLTALLELVEGHTPR
ncbi:pyridoxal phosphate-dependent decarboxylase family protein [Streptomyces endophyticus]|uniref:Aminotransferase class V-fold PLP-dependent enzyme n=1 Tax=Streptomyces endophyticus TaxID=714166 RepID=A0ABU6F9F5_9ACTN|nr:aminotransferase class V-fold PLP-dependent enzyme [Streptomyces endophyticus]MEB8339481.1 aminotransferase class V-fold PLP-dependent enzyme [Streptomyces endophyticus]